jgi:adenylate cyclase
VLIKEGIMTDSNMKRAFDSKTLEELLPKYICHKCVDKVLEYNRKGTFGGEVIFLTVMFVDIHGFSTFAEKIGPQDAMNVLNANYDVMIETVFEYKGAILKFIGDGMMVAFGLPKPEEDDIERSLQCAIKMRNEINKFQNYRNSGETIKIGIGIHCGDVVLGNIGNHRRLDFTIIGDAVNIAARLADIARSNEILVTEEPLTRLNNNKIETEFIEDFLPRGKTQKIKYYLVK